MRKSISESWCVGLMEMTIKRRSEMNGVDLFVDTNVLINLAEGRSGVDEYLESNNLFVSVITEIEL